MSIDSPQWREDLVHLVDRLRHQHPNLTHSVSAEAIERTSREIDGRIPFLTESEIIVEFARLLALIGDGHTVLRLANVARFRRYPIHLYRFSEGVMVRAISRDHQYALGGRLLAIDATPAHNAYEAMRSLISRDNEMGMHDIAPRYLAIPEVLHARGIADQVDRATFTIQLSDGRIVPIALEALSTSPDLVDANASAPDPLPYWLRNTGTNWFEQLDDGQSLYVAFNGVQDSPVDRLDAFFDRVFAMIDREAISRLILDNRNNGGGNNTLNRPLIHHLVRDLRIQDWGQLYAIVGRQTFSAAVNLAVDLERHTRTIFVGEPTGSSPNHYGESGSIVLPHCTIQVSVSELLWQSSEPHDTRTWIAPELPARLSMDRYATNRDPAMEAILNHELDEMTYRDFPDRVFAQLRRVDRRFAL
jgi:hypothetical protein